MALPAWLASTMQLPAPVKLTTPEAMVQAPAVEGRANSALVAFLAETFGLPKNAVELIGGELSRSKVFLLRGVTLASAAARLAPLS